MEVLVFILITRSVCTSTATGNVGIGVVPETTYVQKTTLRLSSTASLIAGTSYYPYPYYIANNLNYDASDNLKYIANSGGALLSVNAHTGGSFSFYTAPAGTAGATASLTERLRIDSSGGISKNGSFSYSGTSDDFYWNTGTGDRFRFHSGTTSSRDILGFSNPNGVVGSIETSGTSTSYNTSSDYRLKTAVTYDWDATSTPQATNVLLGLSGLQMGMMLFLSMASLPTRCRTSCQRLSAAHTMKSMTMATLCIKALTSLS